MFDDAIRAVPLADREPPRSRPMGLPQAKASSSPKPARGGCSDDEAVSAQVGTAGQRIVIEDFLPGEEASFFAFAMAR